MQVQQRGALCTASVRLAGRALVGPLGEVCSTPLSARVEEIRCSTRTHDHPRRKHHSLGSSPCTSVMLVLVENLYPTQNLLHHVSRKVFCT